MSNLGSYISSQKLLQRKERNEKKLSLNNSFMLSSLIYPISLPRSQLFDGNNRLESLEKKI